MSENDAVRRIAFGDKWHVIRHENEPVRHVDVFTEARHYNGTVAITFGAIVFDANNEAEVQIVSRLRMNLAAAQALQNLLDGIIRGALTPPDTSKAN